MILHFRIHFNLYFKMGQSAKSLLWISVFIHGEIRANCHKKIAPRLATELENGLLARVIPRMREIDFSWLWKFSLLSAFSMILVTCFLSDPSCDSLNCKYYSYCTVPSSGIATCTCPDVAACGNSSNRVCGTDGLTYDHICHLTSDACKRNHEVRVLHAGLCIRE